MARKQSNESSSKIFTYSSLAAVGGYIFIAVVSLYYGFVMYNNRLLEAAEQNGKAMMAAFGLAFLMATYAVLSILQMKF